MADEQVPPEIAEILQVYENVPQMARLRTDVLMGDVWEQPELAPRDKSIVTCAILATLGRDVELRSHVQKAVENGITAQELRGMVVHVAFYAGWPAGLAVGRAAKDVFAADAG